MGATVGRGSDETAAPRLETRRTLPLVSERSTAGDAPAEVTLLEPARLRLIEIAADVLGTLASEDVPPPLRAVARFTPGKRARLGATALASTLDADEDFRGRVADLVTESSPLLVQAVRENTPTPAADPLDTAITAYLIRPDGWQDLIAAANERYVAAREHRAAGTAELTRLRDDNAALRARLKAETARLRSSEVEVEERANAELAELRRRVRSQGREIRQAQRERDDALAARSEALERAAAADSAHEAEVRRLRARITELERAGESARRSVRVDRDLDDARSRCPFPTSVRPTRWLRPNRPTQSGPSRIRPPSTGCWACPMHT
jgi:hypothetical protein